MTSVAARRSRASMRQLFLTAASFTRLCSCFVGSSARAGVIFNLAGATLGGGSRWDAAPRNISGFERSLNGGLRYSVQGGSFQAYRDLFTWSSLPSVTAFQTAVQQAFDAWT